MSIPNWPREEKMAILHPKDVAEDTVLSCLSTPSFSGVHSVRSRGLESRPPHHFPWEIAIRKLWRKRQKIFLETNPLGESEGIKLPENPKSWTFHSLENPINEEFEEFSAQTKPATGWVFKKWENHPVFRGIEPSGFPSELHKAEYPRMIFLAFLQI